MKPGDAGRPPAGQGRPPNAQRLIRQRCEICGAAARPFGSKVGGWRKRPYHLRRCDICHFVFVEDPDTDYGDIYSEAYYSGKGADPLVDYEDEWHNAERTLRTYEWQGIATIVRALTGAKRGSTWLDYGCGNGGLLRWLQTRHDGRLAGYDSGYIVDVNRSRGLPMLDDDALDQWRGQCDVVTAIEMLEHVTDPAKTLRTIADLLRPGGVFFYTTGNAAPFRSRFTSWGYVMPEVHISFYEPTTMQRLLEQVGLTARYAGYVPGFDGIIQYKTLKTLGLKHRHPLWSALPWPIISRLIDRRYHVSDFPVGIKPV